MIWWFAASAWAGTLSGTVTDLEGEPIAGVFLAAYDGALRQGESVGPTGIDGRFSVELEPGLFRLRVVPGMAINHVESWFPGDTEDVCQARVLEVPGEGRVQADIALAPGVSVSGVVLDDAAQVVVGARVSGRPALGASPIQTRQAVSGTDGAFEVRGLSPDRAWALRIQTDLHPNQWFPGEMDALLARSITGEEGEAFDVGSSALLPGIAVSGAVSGPDGALDNAVVSVFSGGQIRTTRSDGAGAYRVVGLPPGDITAWVDAESHSRAYWPDSPVPGDRFPVPDQGATVPDFDVLAPFEAVVNGTLTADLPLDGAGVLWVHESGRVGLGAPVASDGRFEVREVPPGRWNLAVSAEEQGFLGGLILDEDEQAAVWNVEAGQTIEVQAALTPAVGLSGTVYDEAGEPFYNALVTARSRDTDQRFTARTDEQGLWSIVGLPGGDTWDLFAEGDPPCPGDLDHVRFYYPQTPDPEAKVGVALAAGARLQWDVSLPEDSDRDQMADTWERENGLDVGVMDARDDPDGDGLINLIEYWEDIDPFDPQGGACSGCSTGGPAWWVWLGLPALVVGRRRRA
ncbi:MAG: carboxypeptidase regulatory-like domain-containing protein [Myxococcota bacterium]